MCTVSADIQCKYNSKKVVCIVDDGFLSPAQALEMELYPVLRNNHIEDMLKQRWDDIAIKNLCDNLLKGGWDIQAFSGPKKYENKIEEDVYISDILIFDWEYATGEVDQVGILKKILTKYPVFVYIFSGADTEDEVQGLIENELRCFKERIKYLPKCIDNEQADKAAEDLSSQLEKMKENNFSFYFGSGFRKIVANSVENILVKFADLKLENVLALLSHDENISELNLEIKKIISSKVTECIRSSSEIREILSREKIKKDVIDELIGILEGKIQNSIISAKLPLPKSENSPHSEEKNTDIMGALWSFRLYYKPLDEDRIVRTGDIIVKKSSTDFSNLYLVITDDCSLSRFAKKTGGILNTVELTRITPGVDNKIKIKGLTSLTNIAGLSGTNGRPLLLPYIPVEDNQLRDYLLLMQRHFTIECKVKEGSSLIYDDIDYRRVCSISSPFLHPLIGTIISNLFGWGCPDYPPEIQEDIKKRCEVKNEEKQRNTEV